MAKVISGSIEPATLRRKTFSGRDLELVVRNCPPTLTTLCSFIVFCCTVLSLVLHMPCIMQLLAILFLGRYRNKYVLDVLFLHENFCEQHLSSFCPGSQWPQVLHRAVQGGDSV